MSKRLLAVLLSLMLIASLFVGCTGGTNKNDTPSGNTEDANNETDDGADLETKGVSFPLEEPVTLTMFAIMNSDYEIHETMAFKAVAEKTNINWEIESVLGAELGEKRNLLLATGEYPDVFCKASFSMNDLEKYGDKEEILIELNDLIDDYAPNFKKILEEREDVKDRLTTREGKIYSLPEIAKGNPAVPPYFINFRWLDNLGLDEPTNLDELYDVLKAFKTEDANGNGDPNDEIPFFTTTVVPPQLLLPYFGVPVDLGTWSAIMDNELVYVPKTEEFKEFLGYITKLYSEGLLDQNAFVQEHSQQSAIGTSGDLLGTFFDAGAFLTVGRERDRDYKILTPFEEGIHPVEPGIFVGTFAITDKCEHPDIAIAWADQFYDEEGGRLAWMGIEDESYRINEDGTWDWILDEFDDIGSLRRAAGIQGDANHPSIQPDLWVDGMTDPNEKYLDEERARVVAMGADPFPPLKISEQDQQTVASIKADIDPYIGQYIAQVGTGELDLDASWDEFTTTLDNMGLEEMLEIYREAFELVK